ncbi:hypothetical protein PENTCL1PPCAC_22296, partial [Pristionchus entomophagus]
RKHVKFLGTVKYASRACHYEKEQCRRDDIEVWCYMVMEYFNKDNLRWRRMTDKPKIVEEKNQKSPSTINSILLCKRQRSSFESLS